MNDIPRVPMSDGNAIPQVGFGTWRLPEERASELVGHALDVGYRLVDTAHAYNNEAGVGQGLRESPVPREEIVLTTKLWNSLHGYDETLRAFDASLERLGLDYIDLYLVHWPVPMENKYVDTWRAFMRLKEQGLVRSIGVSNFDEPHLRRIVEETGVTPAINQIELHPRFQQRPARDHHEELGILIEPWSPLGQGNVMDSPTVLDIAARHGKTPSQVILRWHIEQGFVVTPRSGTPSHIDENLDVFDFSLDERDMRAIAAMDDPDGRIGPVPTELGAVPLPKRR